MNNNNYPIFSAPEHQEVNSSNDQPKWPTMISYFEELKSSGLNANKNNLIFKCILCGPKEKHISTSKLSNSNLRTHIKITHPNDLAEFNNCMKKRPTNSTTTSHKQLKLSEVGKVYPIKKLNQAEFDKANLRLIIDTVSPFSFIEHPAFVNYCKVTSNKVPASRRSLMRDVEYLYNKMIHEMISELDTVKYVCITADCWSIFHKSYIGFTIHWINPETLVRCSKGLACRRMIGRHTYDNIAESIDKVLDEFKIQNKTTLIVTDNAANFVKTFRIYSNDNDLNECIGVSEVSEENEVSIEITNTLEGEPSNVDNLSISLPPHQRCAAHTMNLIASVDIKDAEKDLAYKTISHKVFKKCQAIFNKQNQSTLSADIIKNHLGRYLITPNATRWNSYYDAMKCILENIDKIEDVCNDLQLATISGPREISFLQEYCNVMKPISRALDILQGDKNVSLGYLLPTINAVHKSLNDMKNIVFCRPLIIALKRGLNKRFTRYMESNMCQVAACLIPKFKLNWAVEDNRNNIKNSLIETLETIIDNASLTNSQDLQSTSNTTSIEHHNSDIEDDFFNFEENNSIISNTDYKLLVDNYLSNKNIKSPSELPNPLKELYIKYNTAVPSSAHVERLFSAGGQLLNKRRGSMADHNFEMTLLLKFNKYFE